MLRKFALFIDYETKKLTHSRRKMEPIVIWAETEEEACRAATAIGEFAWPEITESMTIRVLGPDAGRAIGEIRRPPSP
jgi:hypothetical protein